MKNSKYIINCYYYLLKMDNNILSQINYIDGSAIWADDEELQRILYKYIKSEPGCQLYNNTTVEIIFNIDTYKQLIEKAYRYKFNSNDADNLCDFIEKNFEQKIGMCKNYDRKAQKFTDNVELEAVVTFDVKLREDFIRLVKKLYD